MGLEERSVGGKQAELGIFRAAEQLYVLVY